MRFFDPSMTKTMDDSTEVSGMSAHTLMDVGLLLRLPHSVRAACRRRGSSHGYATGISHVRDVNGSICTASRTHEGAKGRARLGSGFLHSLERIFDREEVRLGRQVGP